MQIYQAVLLFSVVAACCGCAGGKRNWTPPATAKSSPKTPTVTVSQRRAVVPTAFADSGDYRFTFEGRMLSIPINILSEERVDGDRTLVPVADRAERYRIVARVKTILTRFGDPFLGKLVSQGRLNRIDVASELLSKTEPRGTWGGFYSPSGEYVVLGVKNSLARSLAHELCHAFDHASGYGEDDPAWTQANPAGVQYAGRPVLREQSAPQGFVRGYSLSSSLEDRATVLEELLGGNGTRDALLDRAQKDGALREKIDILQSRMPEGRLPWMCPVEASKYGRATWLLARRAGKLLVECMGTDVDGAVRFRIWPEGFGEVRRTTYRLHGGFDRGVVSVKGDIPLEIVCWKEARATATVYTVKGPVSSSVRIDL